MIKGGGNEVQQKLKKRESEKKKREIDEKGRRKEFETKR